MESARTFLFIAFVFLSFLVYNQWQEDHKPEPAELVQQGQTQVGDKQSFSESEVMMPENKTTQLESETLDLSQENKTLSENTKLIEVITDKQRFLISPVGGEVVLAELFDHKVSLEKNAPPLNILENRNGRVFVAQSGLLGAGAPEDGKITTYSVEKYNYQLNEESNELKVNLTWVNNQGVKYTKQYVFQRGTYLVEVSYIIENNSSEQVGNRMYAQLVRDRDPVLGEKSSGLGMQSALAPVYSTEEDNYNKQSFDDIEDLGKRGFKVNTKNGWVAIIQHYFVSAWVPASNSESDGKNEITTKLNTDGNIQTRIKQSWVRVKPGEKSKITSHLYVGPKIQSDLKKIADGLELTVDYSFLWWIGQPLFYLLVFFQKFVINWGVAIILLTIVVKTILYPLARAQYRSFAKMRLLAPKMATMKERYGDDRQQMSMKMMELYKKEKVNPLGGCFPLLIQMPVFIALYWVLMESVELRHAPFMLWINDLSVKDPYFILPLLMGASMYLMQKMQPMSPTMDPMQQKIFQMMPVFMTVFFVFFPAGLVLYWLMNNLISIAQQLYITKQFNNEQEAKKNKSGQNKSDQSKSSQKKK